MIMTSMIHSTAKEEAVTLRKNQRQATLSLHEDTIRRIDEAKKTKKSRHISITLTPDESSRQTILLSTTDHLSPISPSLPQRRVSSITFSRDVQIFEVPKLEYIDQDHFENESNNDAPSIIVKSPSTDAYQPQKSDSKYANNHQRDDENGNEHLEVPVTDVGNHFQSLTGFSPRPMPKFHSQESGHHNAKCKIETSNGSSMNGKYLAQEESNNNISENYFLNKNMTTCSKSTETYQMKSKSQKNQNVEQKEIKGILKAQGPCARVLMNCESSGAHFESRSIRLYKNEETSIGRFSKLGGEKPDTHNAIFDCRVMSRDHASIFYQDESFFIRDLNSSNGTFLLLDDKATLRINNKETSDSVLEVFSGDVIQFGQDIPEVIRRNSYCNPREQIKEKRITKCIRTKLQLFHPSTEECKTRKGAGAINANLDTIKKD